MRTDLDNQIDRMAARQHGVWTWPQMQLLGANRSYASRRVLKGLWLNPYPGVYTHRAWVRTPTGEALAAAWSLEGGLASHGTAALLRRLPGSKRGEIEITVPRGRHQLRSFTVHETLWLPAWHRSFVDGVPCMSLERTLVDLGSSWDRGRLEDAWDQEINARRTSVDRLGRAALPLIGRGHPGTDLVRSLLLKRDDAEPPPESTLERLLYDVVAAGGYGPLTRQLPLEALCDLTGRVDGYLPHVDLVLEADGRSWHTRVKDFERDHRRDNHIQAQGHHVARFTHDELVHDRAEVLATLDTHFRRNGYVRTAAGLWVPAAA